MTPTETLREEHRVILKALGVLDMAASRLAAGDAVPEDAWQALLRWLRAFADARHHAKEETVLFPAMSRAGVPSHEGPVRMMLEEHVLGRSLVAGMAHGEPVHRATPARDYVRLLRDHIDKENFIVFPLADEVLDTRAREQVRRDFESADLEVGGGTSIEAAEHEMDELALMLAAPVAAG